MLVVSPDSRPSYLAAVAPDSNAAAPGLIQTPAPSLDQFAWEPPTRGAVPAADPDCAPDGTFPIEAINVGTRITANDTPVLIASLRVPNESNYTALAVQWWTDYPLIVDLGFVEAQLRIANSPPIAIPLPTYGPLVIPHCVKPGQTIALYAIVRSPVPLADTSTGNVVYVGGSLQAGYLDSQWFQRTADRSRFPQGQRSVTVLIAPGAPMFNPFALPLFVATRVRVTWPQLGAAAAAGRVFITTANQLGAAQALVAIDQSIGNLQPLNSYILPLGDLRELYLGAPAPAGLLVPATVVVDWDVWRIR